MFIADKRNGVLSMIASKRTEGRSYEEFVDEFMDWWLDEVKNRSRDENVQATKS
ncbi:MAG: hypothetical protein NWF12_06225 [Candidatus Bathyarchaeota archaeon]|nr:hypothetical protein [Candidatus Bathyarchaeota archaeon]